MAGLTARRHWMDAARRRAVGTDQPDEGGYALACGARMPERISAVGLACCEGPYDEVLDALDQGMTPEERTLFERIRRDPTRRAWP